jgi:flagellar hook-associated protein 2
MASPITPGTGLGSGLDITSIVNALVASETIADKTQITTQVASVTASLSGVSQLTSALAAFQTALTALGNKDTPSFAGYTATSSNTATLTTTSDNTAVPGTYNVVVTKVATSSQVASAAFSGGATSAIPTGTLNISQNGTAYSLAIPAGATLQSVRDSINADANLKKGGITANIITDGSGAHLVFGSTTTGKGSDISVSGIAGLEIDGSQPMVPGTSGPPPTAGTGGYLGAQAIDADYTVGGLHITGPSNTVTNVGGMTMTLVAAGSSTITVGTNSDGLQKSLQSFVTAYNGVISTLNTLTSPGTVDPTTGAVTGSGAMSGDSLPRSLIAAMRAQLTTVGAAGDGLSVLSQLGITTDQVNGTLSIDATKFASAINDKGLAGQVQTMFTGTNSTNGLLARMGAVLTPYTQAGGILPTRNSSLSQQQSDLADRQAALDLRTSDLTTSLTAKYNAMDLIVGQLKATASSITSFFDSLNAQKS